MAMATVCSASASCPSREPPPRKQGKTAGAPWVSPSSAPRRCPSTARASPRAAQSCAARPRCPCRPWSKRGRRPRRAAAAAPPAARRAAAAAAARTGRPRTTTFCTLVGGGARVGTQRAAAPQPGGAARVNTASWPAWPAAAWQAHSSRVSDCASRRWFMPAAPCAWMRVCSGKPAGDASDAARVKAGGQTGVAGLQLHTAAAGSGGGGGRGAQATTQWPLARSHGSQGTMGKLQLQAQRSKRCRGAP